MSDLRQGDRFWLGRPKRAYLYTHNLEEYFVGYFWPHASLYDGGHVAVINKITGEERILTEDTYNHYARQAALTLFPERAAYTDEPMTDQQIAQFVTLAAQRIFETVHA